MLRRKHTAEEKAAQMAANVEAWCRFHRAPEVQYLDHRWHPCREDRVLIHASSSWLNWLADETAAKHGGVTYQWNIIQEHHPLSVIGIDEDTAVEGWRGRRVFAAIQIIHHIHHDLAFLEVDFDWFSPASGLAGMVGHGLEWLWYRLPPLAGKPKRLTDPFKIAKRLRKAGILT
ncbi:MAG: hypothetical protein GWP08_18615 [Nitrospiraceae bacterium]|nr:hypothetical protein [Nitrospiraceae bacterium]